MWDSFIFLPLQPLLSMCSLSNHLELPQKCTCHGNSSHLWPNWHSSCQCNSHCCSREHRLKRNAYHCRFSVFFYQCCNQRRQDSLQGQNWRWSSDNGCQDQRMVLLLLCTEARDHQCLHILVCSQILKKWLWRRLVKFNADPTWYKRHTQTTTLQKE